MIRSGKYSPDKAFKTTFLMGVQTGIRYTQL